MYPCPGNVRTRLNAKRIFRVDGRYALPMRLIGGDTELWWGNVIGLEKWHFWV